MHVVVCCECVQLNYMHVVGVQPYRWLLCGVLVVGGVHVVCVLYCGCCVCVGKCVVALCIYI